MDKQPFIAFDNYCEMRVRTDRLFADLEIRPKITMETAQDVLIYSMVAADQGLSIVPRPIGVTPYHIKVLKITNPIPNRAIYMQWNKERYLSPAITYFRDYVIHNGQILDQFMERIEEELGIKGDMNEAE